MKLFIRSVFLIITVLAFHSNGSAQIKFKEGDSYHVKMSETLYLRMQTSQVDSSMVEPSTRVSEYDFTETIEKVNPDGSAVFASTLDSFTTRIIVGKLDDRNEFFRFNSNNSYDLQNRLKDIRALPRAQFLGQTIRYTLGTDGLVKNFLNLSNFQVSTIARNFEYDMLHAMMSLSDSLRVGQLLEHGFGAIAAFSDGNKGMISYPSTITELHGIKKLKAERKGDQITFTGDYENIPEKIDYLEGIAFPMGVENFVGKTRGSVTLKEGIAVRGMSVDSGKLDLHVDTETINDVIVRNVTFHRQPVKVLRGATIRIKEIEQVHTPPKVYDFENDPRVKMIDPMNTSPADSAKQK